MGRARHAVVSGGRFSKRPISFFMAQVSFAGAPRRLTWVKGLLPHSSASVRVAGNFMNLPRLKIGMVSWRDALLTLGPFLLVLLVAAWIALHFVRPAPPDTIVIT